ncbi:YggS family pyridoxal phosphate-dependent enzyme [Geomonas sp. Red69]|uniref:YggS family pyridoxal phosphate-dependent enzyme n=1 Tax=Geomonas diazotrophica TaxID=2843197 RepID=UPI001C1191CF|nr:MULTISPECIES: YggS family pyridoxal phosphate-dependent enzyme [Geomonas]MBU5637023.1 YggS family pyridoxal phosphate-dependent enzyme [Geomonas diazotrophica]QXE88067.1 YggS family pyridoxal phosphate-dependent enzyme [Geomonas nitrogeniifigens]
MGEIAEHLKEIRERIAQAAARGGRDPEEVRLVAVSKTKPAAAVAEAFACGQTIFGENYVQELVAKQPELPGGLCWHFIGSLQSNKVRQIAGKVDLIHSVDRLSLAREIDRQWGALGKACDILVQVNISREETKGGTSSEELIGLVRELAQLPHLRVKGLMTMPPFFDDPEGARPYFRKLRELADEVRRAGIPAVEMRELSMGMSGDFEAAIEEGATLVRVGSALFGERHYH